MKAIDKENLQQLTNSEVFYDQPLANYTTFKIGGPAEVLVKPSNLNDLKKVLTYINEHQLQYWILGNGSNLLISDRGLSGVVLLLSELKHLEFIGTNLKAGAGVKLPKLIVETAEQGLSGLESLAGLPASLGGAIASNAGANGVWISDLLLEIKVLNLSGEIKIYDVMDLDFDYRSSSLEKNKEIIIEVVLDLKQSNPQVVKNNIQDVLTERSNKQPLSYPNAGCIFKNPKDDSAGRLIEAAGAKGLGVGDAQVSEQHANFIINQGQATYQDVLELIVKIEELVEDKFSVELEREIVIYSSIGG